MKTKRRATPLPARPEQISPPTRNITSPSIGRDVACTSLTTKSLEPNNSSVKKSGHDNIIIFRRSTRIKNSVYRRPCIRDAIEPVIQVIDPSGSEKDDPKDSEELLQEPELNQSPIQDIEPAPQNQNPAGSDKETEEDSSEENSLEPETEIPVQRKTDRGSTGSKNKSEMQYRTLYLESQKKIEELTQAKNELSMKLAVAEGKLEVYEKGSGILSSILDKAKDTFMASALSQATEHTLARATSLVEQKRKRKPSTATTRKKTVASLG